MRPSQHSEISLERSRIVGETESVDGPLIGEQLSPPESGFYSNRRHIAQLMHRWLCGIGREHVSVIEIEGRIRYVSGRPPNLPAPFSRHIFPLRIRRVPVLHINRKRRFFHDSCIAAFQPIIPPAQRLIAPFNLWTRLGVV